MKFKHPKMVELRDQIKIGRMLPQALLTWGEKRLGLHALNVAHEHIDCDWDDGCEDNFFHLACKYLNLQYDLTGLENIPKEGPCVVVSNHPHGMSDGLMFGDIVMKVRQDIRIVVNEFLECVRGMRPYEITVDVYGGEAAKRANMAGMREILRWLKAGHCILVFPSGSAATYSRQDGRVIDDPWQENISTIIRKTGATVVPMHISGRTGIFFQVVSMISRGLRSNFLAREILRDGRMRHSICLGPAIPPTTYGARETDAALSDYLRLRTMLLSYNKQAGHATSSLTHAAPLAEHEPPHLLQQEIAALPQESLCYKSDTGPLWVYVASAAQIPHLLREIGIERERSFRNVSEGTGRPYDLDECDYYYEHLIMWDHKENRLAGAYRMGHTDKILKERGAKGLYNSAFFRFRKPLLRTLAHGLEMGRAFIVPEYQRLSASLDTLWMGIGRYLNRHSEHSLLFGTVSISQDYSPASRALLLSYLQQNCMDPELTPYVSPCFPADKEALRSEDARLLPTAVPDIRALAALVSELEGGKRGIPVLLKQYLRLGGRMLSFGIDRNFGNSLDCLVIVSLSDTPDRIIQRYRGKDYCTGSDCTHTASPS